MSHKEGSHASEPEETVSLSSPLGKQGAPGFSLPAASETVTAKQMTYLAEYGTECDVQTLYEGPPKCDCCKNWIEEYPADLKQSAEQEEETKKKALIVRMKRSHSEGRTIALDSIVVQNQQIKELLSRVFHGYRGITADLKKLVFRAPFHPFYYRWKLFKELVSEQESSAPEVAPFSQLIYRILEVEIRDTIEEVEDLCAKRVITYEYLWALFPPGARLYASEKGHDRFFFLERTYYQDSFQPCFVLSVKYIDWDGIKFGFDSKELTIAPFHGTMRIVDLGVYPSIYHPSESRIATALKSRGQVFYDLKGVHYKAYAGEMVVSPRTPRAALINVDTRIVVDASSVPGQPLRMPLFSLEGHDSAPDIEVSDDVHVHETSGDYDRDHRRRRSRRSKPLTAWEEEPVHIQGTGSQKAQQNKEGLTDEQLMLCNSHVGGYSLQDKTWGEFAVDCIKEVEWNDDAFRHLILPKGHKDLIHAFVDSQLTLKSSFNDVVKGKGMGLTILLAGMPGTGKTLTAEAVADEVRRPLYILSAGELGQDAHKLEMKLQQVLDLAVKWRAVLLLDECDVFMAKRSQQHLEHNEIVAVFLRLLEYYSGMLFLTTNQGDAIDPAFQSRIHLTLHYPDLNAEARESIWTSFAARSEMSDLSEDDFTRLSELSLNGREIKNVVQIACLLARREGSRLEARHVQVVLDATKPAQS